MRLGINDAAPARQLHAQVCAVVEEANTTNAATLDRVVGGPHRARCCNREVIPELDRLRVFLTPAIPKRYNFGIA